MTEAVSSSETSVYIYTYPRRLLSSFILFDKNSHLRIVYLLTSNIGLVITFRRVVDLSDEIICYFLWRKFDIAVRNARGIKHFVLKAIVKYPLGRLGLQMGGHY